MNKFASDIFTKPVVLEAEKAIVGLVKKIVIDPTNGKLVGLVVKEGFGKKHEKSLSAKDILGIANKFILIKSYSALGELDEIVRVKEILDLDIEIIGNKVYTVSGQYLGFVKDFTLDITEGVLNKIYVTNRFFGGLKSDKIISFGQIVSIEKDKIVVENATIKGGSAVSAEPEAA